MQCLLLMYVISLAFQVCSSFNPQRRIAWLSSATKFRANCELKIDAGEDYAESTRRILTAFQTGRYHDIGPIMHNIASSLDFSYLPQFYMTMESKAFNIGLRYAIERSDGRFDPHTFLDALISLSPISSDTFNTILSGCISVFDHPFVVNELFKNYVLDQKSINISVRTLNILMEANRVYGDYKIVQYYYSLFDNFPNLQKDSITYSTLVRSTSSEEELNNIWSITSNTADPVTKRPIMNVALFRCFLESYGAVGASGQALNLALQVARLKQLENGASKELGLTADGWSIFESRSTGDALFSALCSSNLLTSPSAVSPPASSASHCQNNSLSVNILKVIEDNLPTINSSIYFPQPSKHISAQPLTDIEDLLHLLKVDNENTKFQEYQLTWKTATVKTSSKGYVFMFAYMQRRLRYFTEIVLTDSGNKQGVQMKEKLSSIRNELWASFQNDVLLASTKDQNLSSNALKSREYLPLSADLINIRTIDVILRSFLWDFKVLQTFWYKEFVPFIQRMYRQGYLSQTSFLQILRKALETMMFAAGYHTSPSFALEIVQTVNNRADALFATVNGSRTGDKTIKEDTQNYRWSLYRSYENGKLQQQQVWIASNQMKTRQWQLAVNKVVFAGLENTLMLELGVLGAIKNNEKNTSSAPPKIEKIRIQFK